jgi:hypothetical protein
MIMFRVPRDAYVQGVLNPRVRWAPPSLTWSMTTSPASVTWWPSVPGIFSRRAYRPARTP